MTLFMAIITLLQGRNHWKMLAATSAMVGRICPPWFGSRILKREDKRQMTSLHRHFHCFLKILIFIAGGNDSFVVKNKFRAFWCLICLCSWIRSYLPPGHGRTVTSSAVTRSLKVGLVFSISNFFTNKISQANNRSVVYLH